MLGWWYVHSIAHNQPHRAKRRDISSWIWESLPSGARIHRWCKQPARANGRLVHLPQHLQNHGDTQSIFDSESQQAGPAYIRMFFIEVYIGANEIHVDSKQCMKLDVLGVNC